MVFNVDQTQYIGDLTESAGMKVLVHNANHMPFPEDQGVTVAPGELTSIGVLLVGWLMLYICSEISLKTALVHKFFTPLGRDLYCSPCRLYGPTYRSPSHIPLEVI